MGVILPPTFRSNAIPDDDLEVLQVDGTEGISKLYRVELQLQTVQPSWPYAPEQLDALLTETCTLGLVQNVFSHEGGVDAQVQYPIHGVLSEVEIGSIEEDPGAIARIQYRAVLVPRLWYTTRTVRTRLFQGMGVPEIIEHVLKEVGFDTDIDFSLAMEEPHPEREYVLQYKESDFQFISRLAEEEGIFFFFEQREDRDFVVFADHNQALPPYPLLQQLDSEAFAHIHYEPRANARSKPGLRKLTRRYRKTLAGVVVHDHDHTHPDIDTRHAMPMSPTGAGMVHYYLEAKEYTRVDQAAAEPMEVQCQRFAKIRAQEKSLERELLVATSTVLGLCGGYTFELENHFDDTLVYTTTRQDKRHRYLVTGSKFVIGRRAGASESERAETLGFHADLEIVNAALPFRPPRVTPRPVVAGLLSAKVADLVRNTGADLDDYGQYGLVLDLETVGAPALNGSTLRRFRMAQPFAGTSYGMHFPLHVGCEVVLAHLGGDPDRPVILGAVPNHAQRPPVDASNPNHAGFRTRSNIILMFNDDA